MDFFAPRDFLSTIGSTDPLFSASFRATLSPAEVETVKLPARSPNLNAHAERFLRPIKHECLNRLVPLGEIIFARPFALTLLITTWKEITKLSTRLISELPDSPCTERDRSILCRERLGGILRYYYREAA